MKRLIWKFLMPDEATGGAPANEATPTPGIPQGDVDLLAVAKTVLETWLANPLITLLWINTAQAAALVQAYADYLKQRMDASGSRATQTQKLENLDAEIDKNEEFVKGYLIGKYGPKDASSHYTTFGMIHRNDGWGLPDDKQERSLGMGKLIDGLALEGLNDQPFGKLYWIDVKARYDDSLQAATSEDGKVSENAGNKNIYKLQIVEFMVALRFVLRGNYPKTYQSIWRKWGWQKEDY